MIVFLFWFSIGAILYTYIGYPLLLMLLARFRQRPWLQNPITPTVALVIPAYNEADCIAEKIENSVALHYPREKLEIIVISDGSSDETAVIAEQCAEQLKDNRIHIHNRPERSGKLAVINWISPQVQSEIIIYTDANAMLMADSIHAIVRNFADATVGCVSGEKRVGGGGEGLYWRYESKLKELDSKIGSVMGATGELFAIRQSQFQPIPANSIIEDFVMSMSIVAQGQRVIYEPDAIATEDDLLSLRGDWQRRTRIAAGCFQTLFKMPGLLDPRATQTAWQYFSHKVLRWLTPFLLPLLLLLNGLLISNPFYAVLFVAQILFYGLGAWGWLRMRRGKRGGLLHAIFFFFFTNFAIIAGFWRFVRGQQSVMWQKSR